MKIIQNIKNLKRFLEMDKSSSPRRDFAMLKDGFFSSRHAFYPFAKFDKALFLTDWEIEFKFPRLNSSASQQPLKNKLFFQLFLKSVDLNNRTPGFFGIVESGTYQPFSGFKTLEDVFSEAIDVFVKPISGAGGKECFIAKRIADIPKDGSYIIERRAVGHAYSERIFPYSINTIRVFTLKNRAGKPFIVGAAHRFGVQIDQPVDNFSRGGIACGVDLDSGELSSGITSPGLYRANTHHTHPTTQEPLSGVIVPFWNDVKQLSLDLATHFQSLNYAGWDIYVSPTGARVIEGNGGIANPDLIQVHNPLLDSKEVREQLFELGVLSKKRVEEIERIIIS